MTIARNKKANILALVTDAFGGFGGIAAYNRHFLSALAEDGNTVTVLPLIGNGTAPSGIRQLSPQRSKLAYSLTVLRLLFTTERFDLVWCGHTGLAPLARFAAMRNHCPWWLQIHGIDAWDPPGLLNRRAVVTANLVTAVSRYTRRQFLKWVPLAPERVRVLPNTVEDHFAPGPKPRHLLERYGLNSKRVLLTIGRISVAESYKGHDRVIKLLPELLATHPDVVYVIAGDGDGRPALEDLAERLGVADACLFIGKVDETDLVEHYRMADVFVMPSKGEGFGIVYLEAMACGIPAIGLNCDGSSDPLEACSLGAAVPEQNLIAAVSSTLDRSNNKIGEGYKGAKPFLEENFVALVRLAADSITLKS